MEQLYLFEVLVDKITFGPTFGEIPDKKEIQVAVVFAHLISLVVESEDMRGFMAFNEPFKPDIKIDSGKSHLFPCQANELYKAVTQAPLELFVKVRNGEEIGRTTIPWSLEIVKMIDNSRMNPNNMTPVSSMGTYDIVEDGTQMIVGKINIFIRLSCLGQSVQTQFQVLQRDNFSGEVPQKKYLFKSSNAGTTFQAQKYGPDENSPDILPIAPILDPADPKVWFKKGYVAPEDLSADALRNILCKNKHCPGAQKFKEYGLGPAATGKGLGTVYGPTDAPVSYGLSQTYGNLDNYGPYGFYSRPKSLDQPFIPKDKIDCSNTAGCNNDTSKHQNKDEHCCCHCNPLRLTGGAPIEEPGRMPAPMLMCKDLMQSFDKVLDAYKKAMGPCGKGICPYSQNVTEQSCKKFCSQSSFSDAERSDKSKVSTIPIDMTASRNLRSTMDLMSACGTAVCPFSRQTATTSDKAFKGKQMTSACGSPTCPYSKKKLGVATDDDMLELQLMEGPTVAQPCGAPKCPFPKPLPPTLPPLQPIHWDCPDPLPKGPCRNPQCPLKPKELRYSMVTKGPCGSSDCPYATPPFCGDPSCPFGPPQSCPYAPPPACPSNPPSPCYSPQCLPPPCGPCGTPAGCNTPPSCGAPGRGCINPSCGPPPCPSPPPCGHCCCPNPGCPSNPPSCGDPFCPFNPPAQPCPGMPCPPPPCPAMPCPPPPCPALPCPPRPCPAMKCPPPPCPAMPCPPPPCPAMPCPPLPCPPPTPCDNPNCPFRASSPSSCGNPNCPFAAPKPQSPCGNPDCEFAQKPSPPTTSILCENPECPFKISEKESPCYVPAANEGLCDNPECPYKQLGESASNDICDNPDCPYATKPEEDSELCGNPNCPFMTAKESPCYVPQPLCNVPNCPFNKMFATNTRISIQYDQGDGGRGGGTQDATRGTKGPSGQAGGGESPSALMGEEKEVTGKRVSKQMSQSAPSLPQQSPVSQLPTSVSEKVISKSGKRKKRRKRKSKYIYKLGDLYPGVHIGHRECIIPGRNVPAKMGWLWNVHVPCLGLRPRLGWRPGAVARTVANKIIAHRKSKGLKLLEPLTPKSSKKKLKSKYSEYESDSDVTVAPKPTLQIKKREGCYYITMNPLKDPKTIEENENPYMDCTPMQFKITKKQDKDKEREEEGCTCGEDEKSSESSDSELDIEFTPPAGVIRPERLKRKKNVVHTDTQYSPEDFATKDPKKGKDKGGKKGGKKGDKKDKKGGKKGKGKKK